MVDKKAESKLVKDLEALNQAQRVLGLWHCTEEFLESYISNEQCSCDRASGCDSVLVSLDVECWEGHQQTVTEIGISVFDTRFVIGRSPGKDAWKWRNGINSHHFRILENAHLRNHKFISGRPEDFRFGKSEFVQIAHVPKALQGLLSGITYCCGTPRNVTIVGHDVKQDLVHVKGLGFDIMEHLKITPGWPVLDTQQLCRAMIREDQNVKLATLLNFLDIDPFSMHNAGNDAKYTMQAFLAIAVRTVALERALDLEEEPPVKGTQDPDDWS